MVKAYADGRVELPAVPEGAPETVKRYAPRVGRGAYPEAPPGRSKPYTSNTLGEFLGWDAGGGASPVNVALAALELIEEEDLEEDDFERI